jgi:hypothetical protein
VVQGLLAVAAVITLQAAVAFFGSLVRFAAPSPTPKPRTPKSSGGGGNLAPAAAAGSPGGSGGGAGEGKTEIERHDPERGCAEAMDLGEPISIIATVIEEGADAGDSPEDVEGSKGPRAAPGFWRRLCCCCCACCCCCRGARRARAAAAGAAASSPAPAPAAPPRGPDPLVGVVLLCSALLAMAAALRAVSLRAGAFWWEDKLLFPLQALPELLSALLLVGPPHFMARVGMASRYQRWQPKKGKPATSRPKNSNPAIWKRAGLPAPESRTQTQSEGV